MQDKTLTCRDCGREFTFTASEQEFFAQRGFTNEPGRCPECRAARKAQAGGGTGGSYGRSERQMYPAVCAECGKSTHVPFQPREDKPVYCSDCYASRRPAGGYDRGGSSRGGGYGRSSGGSRW
jgi:CxxC-x17-CxxC domain-containing protein